MFKFRYNLGQNAPLRPLPTNGPTEAEYKEFYEKLISRFKKEPTVTDDAQSKPSTSASASEPQPPREWWIYDNGEHFGSYVSETPPDDDELANDFRRPERIVQVVEKSALDEARAELAELREVVSELAGGVKYTNSRWPHEKKLHEELAAARVAHTETRRALEGCWVDMKRLKEERDELKMQLMVEGVGAAHYRSERDVHIAEQEQFNKESVDKIKELASQRDQALSELHELKKQYEFLQEEACLLDAELYGKDNLYEQAVSDARALAEALNELASVPYTPAGSMGLARAALTDDIRARYLK